MKSTTRLLASLSLAGFGVAVCSGVASAASYEPSAPPSPQVSSTPAAVMGVSYTQDPPTQTLPFTGLDVAALAGAGGALVVEGAAFTVVSRKRRTVSR
jgi:hypothetical protein